MPAKKPAAAFDLANACLSAYRTNNRINHFLVRSVPPEAWRMNPPGGKGRSIAEMVAHIHNVRLMWLKASGGGGPMPPKLEGEDFTPGDAIEALTASCQAVHDLLAASLRADGRIKSFKPDVAGFLGYLLAHDAHHRGQISMLARQLGHPLSKSAMFGMWEWGTR